MLEYAALRATLAVLLLLPHRALSRLLAALAASFGFLTRFLPQGFHRTALVNLEIAFPEKSVSERKQILSAMWRSWGRYLADTAYLAKLSPQEVSDLVDNDTDEMYRVINETAKSKGVLILTAHFGSFELFHSAMAVKGTPIGLVQRPMNNPYFGAFLGRLRRRFGTQTFDRGFAGLEVRNALRNGAVVAIAFDQGAPRSMRMFAPFFGVQASTNPGIARLALRTGAAVHPAFLVRIGSSLRHRALLGPEIPVVRTGNDEADVIENTRRFNVELEKMIRMHPDHWIWMYRRWRQQPEGKCSPYIEGAPPLDTYRLSPVPPPEAFRTQ